MDNKRFIEDVVFTIIQNSYQGIVNVSKNRKLIIDNYIKSKRLQNIKFVETIEIDKNELKRSVKRQKTTQRNIKLDLLKSSIIDVVQKNKYSKNDLIWNLTINEGEGLAHYACLCYVNSDNIMYYFDPGWNSRNKIGIYNQVYKSFYEPLMVLLNSNSISLMDVSVSGTQMHPIQKCAPSPGHSLDPFCQTWTLWYSLMFCSCRNPVNITKSLFSLKLKQQYQIPLNMSVAIIQHNPSLEEHLEYDRDVMVYKKLPMLKKRLTIKQLEFLQEMPALSLLMLNALKDFRISLNISNPNTIHKLNPDNKFNYPITCST